MKQERPAGCGSDATTDVVPGNIAVVRPVAKGGDGADLTKVARRAAYMRFLRAQRDNPQRLGRGNNMPPETVDLIRQDPASSANYFNLWLQHGEGWGQVQVVEGRTSADSKATAKKRLWMYACQIHAKWPNEADARRKKEDASSYTATWRADTTYPENEDPFGYNVLVDDEETETHEDRWEKA